MDTLKALASSLVPPLCAACGRACRPEATLCIRCTRRLAAMEPLAGVGPPGVDRAWSSAPHEGVARELVAALKFRRLLPIADLMAERIASLAPIGLLRGAIVPVPTAPVRAARRGFDPAAEVAAELAERCGAPFRHRLARRGSSRQLGQRRADRLGQPPRVHPVGPAPPEAVLVDDVLTTGATISACARALRAAGARRVVAVTFSRRL